MPPIAPPQSQDGSAWEPPAADSRLAKTAGASPPACSPPTCRYRSTCCSARPASNPSASSSAPPSTTSACRSAGGAAIRSCRSLPRRCTTPGSSRWPGCAPRPTTWAPTASSASSCGCRCTPGGRAAWSSSPPAPRSPPGRPRRAPRPRRQGVHLGPVRPGLLPAAGRGRRAGRVRARHLRLPHRAPERAAVTAAGLPEPGDDAVHPGCLRGPRAGAGPGCRPRRRRPGRPASSA